MVDAASACSEVALESLAEDDSSANIDALLSAHFAFIWRVFRRLGLGPADADDATQQVFMIAATKLDQIEPRRERAFLYGIAVRVRSHARRAERRRREVLVGDIVEAPAAPGPAPDVEVELAEARRLLDELLAKLPDKLRRVLVLAEIEGLEVAAIAECEGIPAGTAASRLRRGRARFRVLLAKRNAGGGGP
jgi:RNA polymerase sigma-70 factor (ECF subfamily)